MYDEPVSMVRKLRESISSREEAADSEGPDLSQREKEILVCVAKGMLNKEIADFYNISIHTVITHRKNITRKTGIKTVAGLTVYALLNNLIDSGSIEL
jgi:DNA-binding CsgD family transcriptional regulator